MYRLAAYLVALGSLAAPLRAEFSSTALRNGAVILCDVRADAPVDVCVVAFDAWPLPWRYGPAEMHVLAAVLDAQLKHAADAPSSAGSDLSCDVDGDAMVLSGVGPRGSLDEMARLISLALTEKPDLRLVAETLTSLLRARDEELLPGELTVGMAIGRAVAPVPLVVGPSDIAASAARCTPDAVGVLRATRLVGARCAVSLIGGDDMGRAERRLADAIGALPAGAPNPEAGRLDLTRVASPIRPAYIGELSWVVVVYVVPGPEDTDAVCFLALEQLLGGGNEGLLFRRLRGEMDLTYTVATDVRWFRSVGLLTLACACDPSQADRVAREMCSVVEELRGWVREEDRDRATARARFELLMAAHRPSRAAADRAQWVVRGTRADMCDAWADELRTVDGDRIRSAAAQWLRRPVVVIGNPTPLPSRLNDGA